MDNKNDKIKQEMDKIEIPKELNKRIILGVEKAEVAYEMSNQLKPESKQGKKRWSPRKKIMFISSVAVILLGLFLSSAFVSPAMAKVISSIPYLGAIFQSEPIGNLIFDELEEKGYKISGTGIAYKPKKEVEVRIEGSDHYFNEVKDDIERTVKGILKSKGYDAYSVKVSKEQNDYVLNGEEKKEKPTLENEAQDIKITKGADKGSQITPAIAEGLMSKKEFKVTGVSYKGNPLRFIISTSILSSDPEAKALGTEIESMIVEFLKSEEISPILGKESYEITVKSKDKKKIN
ncbi:DUF4030 domain-containing protein [Peribacillus simplex]|uniref:DUF4030 domain-containing protein n=2 Tax=Peribacillus TaxID=2675229 RepID=A0AA90T493_9BACI|nr:MULTISPECIES: DUF4030 domain-containing protein [Peribacillus]MDP1420382.1 DUF4030 domain-containing protein [Peribacillus simplex]MDP1453463.1 DUF4030 domain-containing protein [Peribacillus frigoritolerans]